MIIYICELIYKLKDSYLKKQLMSNTKYQINDI